MSAAPTTTASIYSILHSASGLNFAPGCGAPVRDSASLKGVRYGPGHEKYPSWPGEADSQSGVPHGGSSRSKSWTDHTNYPKEKSQPVVRPFMKRPNPAFTQQLKTVMERCEKIPPETFESRQPSGDSLYLPRLDRDGKVLGDSDYSVPSPPERDLTAFNKPQLTQADLEEYAKSYQDPQFTQVGSEGQLTRAELEQYTRAYEESNSLRPSHQTQASYAQSEGYHSYVSSTDSTTTTPFLDRLRRDSDAVGNRAGSDESRVGRESSASSGSSSETLKWHGSLSDVSSLSSSSNMQNPPPSGLIAHSSRVPPPQRHHSESVLYLGAPPWVQRNNQINNQMRRLFPVSTYTVQPNEQTSPRSPPALSVAERISELEKQQQQQQSQPQPQQQQQLQQHQSSMRLNCLENDKRTRVTDHASLKAIQKKALLSFYERHHSAWKSEPQLGPQAPPPQPPPRPRPPSHASRRSSSASDYAGAAWREMAAINKDGNSENSGGRDIRHQHSSSCGSLSTAVLGPLIVGPSISVDDWVPARPPKKPHLRAAYPPPPRPPSPDLPPPSPPPVVEDEVFISDEPLPPPPPEDQLPDWMNRQVSPVKQNQSSARSQTNSSTKQFHSHDRSAFNASASLDSLNRTDMKYNSHFGPDRLMNSSLKSLPDKSISMHYENQSEMIRHSSMMNSTNESHNKIIREHRDCHYETPNDCRKNSTELLHRQSSSELFRHCNDHEKIRNNISRKDSIEHYRNGIDVRLQQQQDCVKIIDDSKNSSSHGRKVSDDGRKIADGNLLMSPRLSDCWRNYDSNLDQQPRSLDSNFSINESRYETNHSKPGPQTPLDKKLVPGSLTKQSNLQSSSYSDSSINGRHSESKSLYQFNRDNNIIRSSVRKDSHPIRETNTPSSFADIKNIFQQGSERQSARFTTTKLVVNGKIANAVHNGTVSPTRKCAPISQFMRNSVRRNGAEIANSSSVEEKEPNGKMPLTLPPQCPPTSHQLSQSKASYLAREPRERDRSRSGILNFEGSYKRTMSPSGGQLTIENQEPAKEKSPPPPPVPVSVTPVPVNEIMSSEEKQPLPETKKAPSQENLVSSQTPTSCDKAETSKTLPRNYSLSVAMKRPARTPRTHSDPVHAASRERDNYCESNNRRIESPKKSLVEELRKEEQKSVSNSRVPSPSVSVATSTDESPTDNNTEIVINCNSISSDRNNSNDNNNNSSSSNNSESRTLNNCDQEPLRLVQRSEVTLRVNATTSDAASQTEAARTPSPQTTILRHPLQEEIECDQLSRDLASQLSPSHRLQGILAPGPEVKRCTDYVSGLFRLDVTPRSRTSLASTVTIPAENSNSNSNTSDSNSSTKEKEDNVQSLPASSAYFTTSECKAKLLTLCSRSQPETLNSIGSGIDSLHQKKEELMNRLSRKLCVLRAEAVAVTEESRVNEMLGEGVTNRISNLARPHEAAKLKLHIKEVGHITSLLLGLSGRLARAENALLGMDEDDNDRKLMEEKRDKLRAQLEEAKQLKVSIDRRSGSVSTMLYKYLSAEEYADYDHFINMKAKLLIDSREISDKIQLGEEQLAALQETLNEQSSH